MNVTPISELRKPELKRLGAVSKVSKQDRRESLVSSAGGFSERGKCLRSHCLSTGSPKQTRTVYGKWSLGEKTGRGLKPHPLCIF